VGPVKKLMARHHGKADERGAELVEFAIVVVLLVTLLYGLFIFGMAFGVQATTNHAADDASRAALSTYNYDIGIGDTPLLAQNDAQAMAQHTVEKDLSWINSSATCGSSTPTSSVPEECAISFSSCGTSGGNTCMTITAAYNYSNALVLPPLFSKIVNISDISSTSTVLLTSAQE
jgi:hypothetical protein